MLAHIVRLFREWKRYNRSLSELNRLGIEMIRPKVKQVDNNWQTWIEDPDGHRIELMEMADDSLQGKAIARLKHP